LGHPFPKRRGLGRAAQGCAGGAPAVMRLVRYLRAGRVLTSALGGPFHSEPENLDPPPRLFWRVWGSLRSQWRTAWRLWAREGWYPTNIGVVETMVPTPRSIDCDLQRTTFRWSCGIRNLSATNWLTFMLFRTLMSVWCVVARCGDALVI